VINATTHDIIIAIERSREKIHQWKSWKVIIMLVIRKKIITISEVV